MTHRTQATIATACLWASIIGPVLVVVAFFLAGCDAHDEPGPVPETVEFRDFDYDALAPGCDYKMAGDLELFDGLRKPLYQCVMMLAVCVDNNVAPCVEQSEPKCHDHVANCVDWYADCHKASLSKD